MSRGLLAARGLCALACLLLLGAWQLSPRSHDLSGIGGQGAIWQDVASVLVSPDGEHVVFVADKAVNGRTELYTVPVTGGTPLRISPPLANGQTVWPYDLDLSSERVVFLVRTSGLLGQIYSVPIDGSEPAVLLDTGWSAFNITPDGTRVLYYDSSSSLSSVPIDASSPPTLLVEAPPVGFFAGHAVPTAAGRVLYKIDDERSSDGIFSVPLDGSEEPVLLPIPSLQAYDIEHSCTLTPDGVDAVYLAAPHLYRVPVDNGSAPVQLNPAPVAGGACDWVQVTPDGTRVVYRADQDTDGTLELYSVPLAGGPSVKLNGTLPPGGYVTGWAIAPDGERVVFLADTDSNGTLQLFSVPIAGGAPVELGSAASTVEIRGYRISPDGDQVAFLSDSVTDGAFTLHLVPIDGSLAPVSLTGPLVTAEFTFSPDGALLVYATDGDGVYGGTIGEPIELYVLPLDGGAEAVRIDPPPVTGGSVRRMSPGLPGLTSYFRFAPGGHRIVWLADQERDETIELYASTLPHVPRARAAH